ncbi:CRISPR-associated endoribonuclease Cas6 [Thermodesulfovibrio yellowstonii]|uniref:CRISPR-associated endoribonuclease Cas6 n=1 Tax=Thermodesulfovibrio yellowstonii TaxID=28262 RepID=A0A9W6GE55_9BACT|nr:CRISPR-associated endoribonuclease Cas6 [Thermodesulfovibrio islandicus]GLI52450.1 CRISPR-associated endoribonuclease Cas6 [Thermodesulfovibrio islandicus]
MRIKVIFHAPKLPILYRNRFMSLIKDSLEKSNSVYKEKLYPNKNGEITKVVKPFCFCVTMPASRKPEREKIIIDNDFEIEDTVFYFSETGYVSLIVSSSDYEFIVNLYNGLLENKSFKFSDDLTLFLKRIIMLNEKKIENSRVTFKTLCPALIETKEGKPILPFDNIEDFNREFNAVHDRILKDIRGYGLKRPLKFEPLRLKKQVVKHTLRGFREKTGKPYMTLTCFEGSFKLSGDQEDLRMLYQIGIGLRTGQGFGMVEVC